MCKFLKTAHAWVFALLAAVLMVVGCDGGGGGASGKSTVTGTVNSFSVAGHFYQPSGDSGFLARLLAGIAEITTPSVHAAVGGVTVSIQGTDISGTTDDRGNFILSGVPGGDHVIVFTYNGQTST